MVSDLNKDTYPPVWVILTTYTRTETAIKTIQGVKENLLYPNLGWIITDDGTGGDHSSRLREEIGDSYAVHTYDGERRGVGHNMNWALRKTWELGGELNLILEDDWYCHSPYDLEPAVKLLMNHSRVGMVRMGYLSAGVEANLVSSEDRLWWAFKPSEYQYNYAGHASLRHKRLHDVVGMFEEGLRPGANELNFSGRYNQTPNAPLIMWPADYGHVGPFHHIGEVSLADIAPGT